MEHEDKQAPAQPEKPAKVPNIEKTLARDALFSTPVSDSYYRGLEADMQWRNDGRWN